MDAKLAAAAQLTGDQRVNAFTEILYSIRCDDENCVSDFQKLVNKVVSMSYGTVGLRKVIDEVVNYVTGKTCHNSEIQEQVLEDVLGVIEPVVSSFEEQDSRIRKRLADMYQSQEEYVKAARVLQNGLGGGRQMQSDNDKFNAYILIVRNYLEAGEPENAAGYLSRAQHIRPTLQNRDPVSEIHFKLCQARIYDSNNEFIRAAMGYFDVSRETAVEAEDRLAALGQAVVCSVLAKAGPERAQMLKNLYTDERTAQLAPYLHRILQKVYLDQLLNADDMEEFTKQLAPHQTAKNPDGTTVVSRAVIDHNISSVSKIYSNVKIAQLSRQLNLAEGATETYLGQMISQGRLRAKIDQEQGMVCFIHQEDDENDDCSVLNNADDRIQQAYMQLDDIVRDIQREYAQAVNPV